MKNMPLIDFPRAVLLKHLRQRAGWLNLSRLVVLLVLLYSAAYTVAVAMPELAQRMDSAAQEVEALLKVRSSKPAK